jgi:superfamily I DNA and/or RNA helicase
MKKAICFALCLAFLNNVSVVYGDENKTVESEKANYYIKIPDTWVNYISVESEKVKSGIVEKFNFYYEPRSSANKPLLLTSLYLFNKSDWYSMGVSTNYKKITEDKNYVYAATSATINPYSNREDMIIFKRLTIESNNIEFVKSMIVLGDTSEIDSETITVNEKALLSKVLYLNQNVAYLPIRETCEAMGYGVYWNAAERYVSIRKRGSRQGESYDFYPSNPSKNLGYSVLIENSIAYINYSFFVWELKASVGVDENRNIYIRT